MGLMGEPRKTWRWLGGAGEAWEGFGRPRVTWEGIVRIGGGLEELEKAKTKKTKTKRTKKNKGFRTYSASSWVCPYARLFFLFFWVPRDWALGLGLFIEYQI